MSYVRKALLFNSALTMAFTRLLFLPQAMADANDSRSPSTYCGEIALPQHISIKNVLNNKLYNKSFVNEKNQVIAYIKQNSTNEQFEVFDTNNNIVMTGKIKARTGTTEIELRNCQGQDIGFIKQDVEKSFLSADASYIAEDSNGNFVFQSFKKEEASKVISVTDKNESELGSLNVERSRSKFEANLKDGNSEKALLIMATLKL
ncbi:MAG: hypothetical protein ACXVAX_10775, partial [Pseudobdellovibrio sp.]